MKIPSFFDVGPERYGAPSFIAHLGRVLGQPVSVVSRNEYLTELQLPEGVDAARVREIFDDFVVSREFPYMEEVELVVESHRRQQAVVAAATQGDLFPGMLELAERRHLALIRYINRRMEA